jgi:hypothetical protein
MERLMQRRFVYEVSKPQGRTPAYEKTIKPLHQEIKPYKFTFAVFCLGAYAISAVMRGILLKV